MQTASEAGGGISVPATREIFLKFFCGSNNISPAELEMVTDQLNSFTVFLSLAARLPEVCYNQLCIFHHIQIESKGLNSCKFSRGWPQGQNSDRAQRSGAKHRVRCADAASASEPWKYWGLQFIGLSLSLYFMPVFSGHEVGPRVCPLSWQLLNLLASAAFQREIKTTEWTKFCEFVKISA